MASVTHAGPVWPTWCSTLLHERGSYGEAAQQENKTSHIQPGEQGFGQQVVAAAALNASICSTYNTSVLTTTVGATNRHPKCTSTGMRLVALAIAGHEPDW